MPYQWQGRGLTSITDTPYKNKIFTRFVFYEPHPVVLKAYPRLYLQGSLLGGGVALGGTKWGTTI